MPKSKKVRAPAGPGLTLPQLNTVRAIARERGLELADGWEKDRAYCTALLDHLCIDRQQRPLAEVARFVNNIVREVECGTCVEDLARKYALPENFAWTMHAYALKQLGYACVEDWRADFELLNAAIDEDALT